MGVGPVHLPTALFLMVALCAPSPGLSAPPEIDVPLLQQVGDKNNCGPTAAAMTLGAYVAGPSRSEEDLVRLRDAMGQWSWDAFAVRRLRLPGTDAGASPPHVLKTMLNRFSPSGLSFDVRSGTHPWLPAQLWASINLRAQLESGRPVLALVTSSVIWNQPSALGLHWIVVRGVGEDGVVFNDPADRTRRVVSLARFWRAWTLDGVFSALFDRYTTVVPNYGVHRVHQVAARLTQPSAR